MLGFLYARAAMARRRASRRPGAQRRLLRPVASVGNLCVGGSGKTPTVAHLARLLIQMGERPAILSRGYARRVAPDGVVVVSDGHRLCAGLDESGDEPLLLARAVDGAAVLVSPDRYLAGRLAETRLGATVHVLDDGFQHLPLWRGTDLLIVSWEDVERPRTLPAGRLREPLEAAAAAHALLVADATGAQAAQIRERLGVPHLFRLARQPGAPLHLDGAEPAPVALASAPVYAVAGIARPGRFFDDLREAGWTMAGTAAFADHHRFTARDLDRLAQAARAAGAGALITTEKDLVRLLPLRPWPLPVWWVPLEMRIEPADAFRRWLADRLADERSREGGPRA